MVAQNGQRQNLQAVEDVTFRVHRLATVATARPSGDGGYGGSRVALSN